MKISIESNIGGGKSTLLSRIQKNTRIPVFLEPVDSWTMIDSFYADNKRWGLTFNIEVLLSMSSWGNNRFFSIYERSPMSCLEVFSQLQLDEGCMIQAEMDIFLRLYQEFGWSQDCVIYLDTSPDVCFERMRHRDRHCENNMKLEYLVKVHEKHKEMVEGLKTKNTRLFIVDGSKNSEAVYNDVLQIILKLQAESHGKIVKW